MSERRVDPFTGRGVILAPGRRGLGAAKPAGLPEPAGRCPFCPGHEADTERTVAAWPESGSWQVRVVANRFPIASQGSPLDGAHEVIIDAREHALDLADLSPAHLSGLLRVYRDRVRTLEAQPGVQSVVLFRNRGRRAGSSQPHPHTQIAALSWVPAEVALRWDRARRHFEERGESLHQAVLREELSEETRVLAVDARFAVLCPRAPSRPFEIRVMPRAPEGGFAMVSDDALDALALHLSDAYRRLRAATGIEDHNLVLRQPPVGANGPAAAWHLEILPRTGGDAGFELASGEMIVVVRPEEAAAQLRAASPASQDT